MMTLIEMATPKESLPSNYYAPKAYIQSNPSTGLLSTPEGKRLIAVPDLLFSSIQSTLLTEAGEAATMAFYTFGHGWGKSFYERTRQEMEGYYKTAIAQMNAPEFFATLQEIWGVHGLGKITVNFAHAKSGLVVVTVTNSGISKIGEQASSKSFSLEAGFLSGWFSTLTNQDLSARATEWNIQNRRVQYLIGSKNQIEQLDAQGISEGMRTLEILNMIAN